MILGIPFNNIADIMTSKYVNDLVSLTFENRMFGDNASVSTIVEKVNNKDYGIFNELGFEYKNSFIKFVHNNFFKDSEIKNIEFKNGSFVDSKNKKKNVSIVSVRNAILNSQSFKLFENEKLFYSQDDIDIMQSSGEEMVEVKDFNNTKQKALRAIDKYMLIAKFKQSAIKDLNFNTFLQGYDSAQEITLLGRLFSLNQGIKPKYEDRYSFSKIFNQLFTDRVDVILRNGVKELIDFKDEDGNVIEKKDGDGKVIKRIVYTYNNIQYDVEFLYRSYETIFNIDSFITDPLYAQDIISKYNLIKNTINVFDIINSLPQYKSFLKAFSTESKVTQIGAYKENAMKRLIVNVENNLKTKTVKIGEIEASARGKLNPKLITKLRRLVDDAVISKFFSDSDISLTLPTSVNHRYMNGNLIKSDLKELKLNSADNIATFKYYMDNYVFQAIKDLAEEGKVLSDNSFVKSLYITSRNSELTNELVTYYRLSDNMMNVSQERLDELESDFRAIQNVKLPENDMTIGDLVYLYNLIVHKDGNRQDSFNKVMSGISDNKSSIMWKFNNYLGEMDMNAGLNTMEVLDINIKRTMARLTPIFGSQGYRGFDIKKKLDRRTGLFVYTEKNGGIINVSKDQSAQDYVLNFDIISEAELTTSSRYTPDMINNIIDSISKMIGNGTLTMNIKCE